MTANEKWEITKNQQLAFIKALTSELVSLRAKIGISQGELARLIGVSRQTYSSIECGKRLMSWNTYLSLILFFDYNKITHGAIRTLKIFPEELVKILNNGETGASSTSGIAGIPETITEKLDAQALHAIRTVVMVEYARCANLSGDEVVKAFDGTNIRQTLSDLDEKTQLAISNIREGNKQ